MRVSDKQGVRADRVKNRQGIIGVCWRTSAVALKWHKQAACWNADNSKGVMSEQDKLVNGQACHEYNDPCGAVCTHVVQDGDGENEQASERERAG